MVKAIRKNTVAFRHSVAKKAFMERSEYLHECGICMNVISLSDGRVGCPVHPKLNGKYMRTGHCDVDHLCKTATFFKDWPSKKQREFLAFVRGKQMDWYSYSVKMDNGELLKEFETSS